MISNKRIDQGFTMFVPVACSQCQKPFQVPDAAIGKTTTCPWCQAGVLALPIGSATTEPAKPAEKPGTPEPELLSLDEESPGLAPPSQRPPRTRRGWFLMAALAIVLMAATTTLTLVILQYRKGHTAFEWRTFTPPDGSCSVDLLGPAMEADSDPEHGERRFVSEGWYSGTSAWIGWRNLTASQVQEAASKDGWVQYRKFFFDKEQDRLKAKFGGYVARDATIEQNPISVEVRLDGGQQGPAIERMIVIPGGAHPRIYYLGMSGKHLNLDGPDVKRFFNSFRAND